MKTLEGMSTNDITIEVNYWAEEDEWELNYKGQDDEQLGVQFFDTMEGLVLTLSIFKSGQLQHI